jgi:hypothetical protein
VDESIDVVFCNGLGNALHALNVYIFQGEVPAWLGQCPVRTTRVSTLTSWDSPARSGCRRHRSVARSLPVTGCFSDRIPAIRILANGGMTSATAAPTINTTRPRSPVTFRCLFAISSLNGTTTVHPCRASKYQTCIRKRRQSEGLPSRLTMYLPRNPVAPKTVAVWPPREDLEPQNQRVILIELCCLPTALPAL